MRYFKPVFVLSFLALILTSWGAKETKLTEGIQPGNLAPGFSSQEFKLEGKKLVLLQFWAVYDGKSRMENARMHNIISNLQTDDIQLISVSLDDNQAVFEGAIKADRLNPGTQINKPKTGNSQMYKDYRLESGFNNWLINEQGVIVAKNVSPEEISDYL